MDSANGKPDETIVKVQGTWELAFVEWADKHGLIYECHRGRLSYIDQNGEKRSYYPDFYVRDWNCWVDVKNDYHYSLQRQKFNFIFECNPNETIRILTKKDLIQLGVEIKKPINPN